MNGNISFLNYRILIFLLAVFYIIYICGALDWTYSGGPLRYLTMWGLTYSQVLLGFFTNFCPASSVTQL